jgi:hypothetical protein
MIWYRSVLGSSVNACIESNHNRELDRVTVYEERGTNLIFCASERKTIRWIQYITMGHDMHALREPLEASVGRTSSHGGNPLHRSC